MAVYAVQGTMGSGKSLVCVGRIRDMIQQGRRVATNLDLRLEHLTKGGARTNVTRIPDWPALADFELLGWGSPEAQYARPGQSFDENRNGGIFLDEISSILDARSWADPTRKALIDWLKQSRKRGWDIYFIVQHDSMIDGQVRKALFEMTVVCKRLDRLPIPLIGWIIRATGLSAKLPRVHVATVLYGKVVTERWWYRGNDLFAAYNTRQVFRPQRSPGLSDKKFQSGDRVGQFVEPDDNPQGHYQCLDRYSAPWLHSRRCWRWKLSDFLERRWGAAYRVLGRVLAPDTPGPWFDFWLAENVGPPLYNPATAHRSFKPTERAGRPGALGAEGGEAPEPAIPRGSKPIVAEASGYLEVDPLQSFSEAAD